MSSMIEGARREAVNHTVEIPNDSYNYERWGAVLEGVFTQLGIVRALAEAELSDTDRVRIIAANTTDWDEFLDYFPPEDRDALHAAFTALSTNDRESANRLRDRLAELGRYVGNKIRETAPAVQDRTVEDDERRASGDAPNRTHEWLNGNEAGTIADRLTVCLDVLTGHSSAGSIALYYGIGDVQRLLVLVEKLKEKIDDGQINVGGRDAQECVSQVTAARNMLVRAMVRSEDATEPPQFDETELYPDILGDAADIAGWLSVVKMQSV